MKISLSFGVLVVLMLFAWYLKKWLEVRFAVADAKLDKLGNQIECLAQKVALPPSCNG